MSILKMLASDQAKSMHITILHLKCLLCELKSICVEKMRLIIDWGMVGGLCRDPCKPRAISNVAALLTAVLSQSARNNNVIKRRVLKSVMENIWISYCSLCVSTRVCVCRRSCRRICQRYGPVWRACLLVNGKSSCYCLRASAFVRESFLLSSLQSTSLSSLLLSPYCLHLSFSFTPDTRTEFS